MAGLIPDNLLEQIRSASDIVDVIGGYLPLKRAGGNFVALCPFHKEKSPSFNVNPHKQIFHCFGCHKGGDVFSFVKEYENIGFIDAVRRLADRAKITIELDNNPAAQQTRHIKDQLLQIHEQITQRWQACLANEAAGQLARDYLAKRGVSAEAIKLFRIGAAPEAWDDTVNWAKSKGFELAVVEQAGLILTKAETGRQYDRFRGRLMFPICDEQGRVIGFSGRILNGDEKTAKYVNSPETPIFTKGKVLFALDKAKRAILDIGHAVVCEGQLDTIMCHMHGIQHAVAPQGTALTLAHARILRRYTDNIVLCFDGDSAGQKAAIRPYDDLVAAGIPFGVAVIPPPDDPDSFIRKYGRDKLAELIIHSKEYDEFYLDYLCKENDIRSSVGRQKVSDLMRELVAKCPSAILRDSYAQKTAARLGVSVDAVRKEFSRLSSTTAVTAAEDEYFDPEVAAEAEAALPPPTPAEFQLLKLLFTADECVDWCIQYLSLDWIPTVTAREIVQARLELSRTGNWQGVPAFLVQHERFKIFITEAITRPLVVSRDGTRINRDRPIGSPLEQISGICLRLRNDFADQQIAALTQQLSQPGISDAQNLELLQHLQQWRQYKKQPLAPLA